MHDLQGRHTEARAEYTAALQAATPSEHVAIRLPLDLAISFVFERRFDEAEAALRRWAGLASSRAGLDVTATEVFLDLAPAREDYAEAERVLVRIYDQSAKLPLMMAPEVDAMLMPWLEPRLLGSARHHRRAGRSP